MEWVPGVPLSQKIQNGPMSETAVITLGTQIAGALADAHAENVIHRDLKPANVVVTPRGQAKVLDFGLAKYLKPLGSTSSGLDSLTRTGRAVGTLPYMAPESFRGAKADVRSDVYSAGAVLYEMATGRRPFPETEEAALIHAILNSTPPSPRTFNARISPALESIIVAAMERDLSRRYQDAEALLCELRRCVGAASAPPTREGPSAGGPIRIESLAVLPLANLSGEPGQDYFADGMTEALISNLAQIRALRVVSRQSVIRYKATTRPLPEIARELNVDALVEGSVLRFGDRVRITAQLIDGCSDRHLWANSYERDLRNILELQSEVAWAIAQEIRVTAKPQEEERLKESRTVHPAAYEAYLQGRHFWNKRSADSIRKAIGCFQEAIERDPSYPLAYVGLSDSFLTVGFYVDMPPRETYPKAKAAARHALELDATLAEAHASTGLAKSLYDWDAAAAEESFQRSFELNPSYATAHQWYAEHLSAVGRLDEAITHSMRALELDPLAPMIGSSAGWILYRARRFEEAAQQLRSALEFNPDFMPALYYLNLAQLRKGAIEDAVRTSERIVEIVPDSGMARANLARAYAAAERTDEARALLAEVHGLLKRKFIQSYFIAVIYLALREKDRALEWLERALAERSPWLAWIGVEPLFDDIREEPRFQEILRAVGLMAEPSMALPGG